MEVTPQNGGETIARIAPKLGQQKKSTPFNRSLVLSKPIKSSWKKKMELKNERAHLRALEKEISYAKKAAQEEKRQRRIENQKRREENALKSQIVQQIRNPKKLKKGSKRIRKA